MDPAKVPLLAGELVGKAEGGSCWSHNGVIADLPNFVSNSHVVSSSGLAHKGDGLHFTAAAYRSFGKRYAEKMLSLLGENPVDTVPLDTVPFARDSIYNGSFAKNDKGWEFNVWGGEALGSVVNEQYKAEITSVGTENYQIQLIQPGLLLEKTKSYEISFYASANLARSIDVNVEKHTSPWTSYLSDPQQFNLSTDLKNFTFQFTMAEVTDSKSRLSFNLGASTETVFLDDVSIKEIDQVTAKFIQSAVKLQFNHQEIHLSLNALETQSGALQYNLFDLKGSLVDSRKLQFSKNAPSMNIDLSLQKRGVYLIQIVKEGRPIHFSKMILK